MNIKYYYNKTYNILFPKKKFLKDRKNNIYGNFFYFNFRDGFDPKDFWISNFIKANKLNPKNKKVDFFSVFGTRKSIKCSNHIKIFFTGEHIYSKRYPKYNDYLLKDVDLSIGFREYPSDIKNYFRLPLYITSLINPYQTSLNEIKQQLANLYDENINRERFCALIARHDINGIRTKIYNECKKYGAIDAPSKLLHNINYPLPTQQSKIDFLKNYKFNICPENIAAEGYVTEKIADAITAGCIPIYRPKDSFTNFDKKILNEERIIFRGEGTPNIIKDFSTNLQAYQHFCNQPIFHPNAAIYISEHIQQLKQKLKELFIS